MSRWKVFASLRVTHGWWGGPCSDVAFVVPAETAALFGRGHMIAKAQPGALQIACELGKTGPAPRVQLVGESLRIAVVSSSARIGAVTAPGTFVDGRVAIYRNRTMATQLDAAISHALAGSIFSHPLGDAARPVTVTATDGRGVVLRTQTLEARHNAAAASFDFTGVAPGAVTVTESYPTLPVRTTRYFVHRELMAEALLGIIEIGLVPALYASAEPPMFELSWSARSDTLRYYMVVTNHSDAEVGHILVADQGAVEDKRPRVEFDRVAPPFAPAELPTDVLGASDPAARFVLFRSTAPVARQARPRRKIQLTRNGDLLVEHLPQPRADQPDGNIIIHVSKAK